MATHPGLFVTAAGTTAAAARKDLAGLIVRDTTGKPRAGILPAHTGALVTARASISGNLAVDVGSFLAVTVRDPAGVEATVWGNQGTEPRQLLAAAPAANSRIDRIWVKHNDVELGDAVATPEIGVTTGTAAAVPTVPALPAGALPLAQVLIPAGVTATTAGGVVITQDHPYTATAGGTVIVRTAAEMTAWTPVDGAAVYRLDEAQVYIRRGGVWQPVDPFIRLTITGAIGSAVSTPFTGWTEDSDIWGWRDPTTNPTRIIPKTPGLYVFHLNVSWASNTTGIRVNQILANGAGDNMYRDVVVASSDSVGSSCVTRPIWMNGTTDYVEGQAFQNSGTTLSVSARLVGYRVGG